MDDEIIYSWWFNDFECFDSTPSAAIIILDEDLESFSSLRSKRILSSSTWLNELEWDHVDIRSKFTPFFVTNGQKIPGSSW